MVDFLAAAGIVFVILAFWKGRNQAAREREKLDEYKRVRDELAETRREVGSLLEQLEAVSERVVEEITATVDEARRSVKDGSDDSSVDDDDQDENGENNENEMDEGTPEIIVELTGRPTEIKTYNRVKSQVRPGPNTKPGAAGKTILFPRIMESSPEKAAAANNSETAPVAPPKHQMVYAMDKLGYSEQEIAKQLAVGRGEIRLILQLKRKGEEANG